MFSPTAWPLPYAQATPAQRTQALHYLQARLRAHFPTLPERAFARALTEFRPDLLLDHAQLRVSYPELTQLVQLLATSPELPLLDPPPYGLPALELAQHSLRTHELAVLTLTELVARRTRCGPHLHALVQRLVYAPPLAEQVVQAWRWNLPSSPPLPLVPPGEVPTPDKREIERQLHQLICSAGKVRHA